MSSGPLLTGFLAYRKGNERLRTKIKALISSLSEHEIPILVWSDDDLKPGADWEAKIFERIDDSDLFFLLVTTALDPKAYALEHELRRAISRAIEKKNIEIIPIVHDNIISFLSESGLEEFRFNAIPEGGRGVSDFGAFDDWESAVKRGILDAALSVLSVQNRPANLSAAVSHCESALTECHTLASKTESNEGVTRNELIYVIELTAKALALPSDNICDYLSVAKRRLNEVRRAHLISAQSNLGTSLNAMNAAIDDVIYAATANSYRNQVEENRSSDILVDTFSERQAADIEGIRLRAKELLEASSVLKLEAQSEANAALRAKTESIADVLRGESEFAIASTTGDFVTAGELSAASDRIRTAASSDLFALAGTLNRNLRTAINRVAEFSKLLFHSLRRVVNHTLGAPVDGEDWPAADVPDEIPPEHTNPVRVHLMYSKEDQLLADKIGSAFQRDGIDHWLSSAEQSNADDLASITIPNTQPAYLLTGNSEHRLFEEIENLSSSRDDLATDIRVALRRGDIVLISPSTEEPIRRHPSLKGLAPVRISDVPTEQDLRTLIAVVQQTNSVRTFQTTQHFVRNQTDSELILSELAGLAQLSKAEIMAETRRWNDYRSTFGDAEFDYFLLQLRRIFGEKVRRPNESLSRWLVKDNAPRYVLSEVIPSFIQSYRLISNRYGSSSTLIKVLSTVENRSWKMLVLKYFVRLGASGDHADEFLYKVILLWYFQSFIVHDRQMRGVLVQRLVEAVDAPVGSGELDQAFRVVTEDHLRRLRERLRGRLATYGLRRSVSIFANTFFYGGLAGDLPESIVTEHVAPRRVASTWSSAWSHSDHRNHADTIGNLVLIPQGLAQEADGRTFKEKKHIYRKADLTQIPITESALSVKNWTTEVVEDRTNRFIQFFVDELRNQNMINYK